MLIKKIAASLFVSSLVLAGAAFAAAQDATSQSATAQPTPNPQQQQEEKLKLETKANALLEQVIAEAQALKLPENRIRVQIAAADMLWDKSAPRARGLFADAAAILGQMMLDVDRTERNPDRNYAQTLNQLRQDLVLAAGRHDAELGYQLLRSTQPPTPVTTAGDARRLLGPDPQNNLEQNLLATIAATDPKVAYQKASESLDKGEYPNSLDRVLAQLQSKDQEAFKKLSEKTLSRLGSDNIVSAREATSLAMSLLAPGPRVAPASTGTAAEANTANPRPAATAILSESAYHDLMDNVVTAALTVTSPAPGGPTRGVGPGRGGGARVVRAVAEPANATRRSAGATEQCAHVVDEHADDAAAGRTVPAGTRAGSAAEVNRAGPEQFQPGVRKSDAHRVAAGHERESGGRRQHGAPASPIIFLSASGAESGR